MIEGTLMAVRFDLRQLEVMSGPVPVVEGIRRSLAGVGNTGQFDISQTGVLVFAPGPTRAGQDGVFLSDRRGDMTALKLPPGSYLNPRVSPDGKRLAFETHDGRQAAIAVYDLAGTSSLRRLTFVGNNRLPIWSADGKSIAFTQLVPEKKPPLATPPEKPEGAQWAPPVKVIDSVVYRADGEGYLEAGYQHVFVVSAEGGTPRQLTDGEFNDDGPLSFTPDNKRIVFSANRGADWERDPQESEVFTVDIATGKLTQLTKRDGPDNSPVVSPDGRYIAYLGFDDRLQGYQVTHLYVMDSDGANSRELTADLDRDVADPRWSADSRSVYFSYDERGVRKLGITSLNGKLRMLADGLGGIDLGRPYTSGSFSVARNGRAAFAHNTTARPADVATVAGGGSPRVLTALNDDLLGNKVLGTVKEITWKSSRISATSRVG